MTEGISHNSDSDGDLNVFNVNANADGLWLNTDNGHPDNRFDADNRVVFAVPAQLSSFLRGNIFCGVLFFGINQRSVPTAKHSPDFVE